MANLYKKFINFEILQNYIVFLNFANLIRIFHHLTKVLTILVHLTRIYSDTSITLYGTWADIKYGPCQIMQPLKSSEFDLNCSRYSSALIFAVRLIFFKINI